METSLEICLGNAGDHGLRLRGQYFAATVSLPPFVYLFQSTVLLFDPHHRRNVETASDNVNSADLRSRSVREVLGR